MGRLLVQLVLEEPTATLAAAVEAPGHPALGRDAGEVAGVAAAGVPIVDRYAPPTDSVTLDFTAPAAALQHLESAAAARRRDRRRDDRLHGRRADRAPKRSRPARAP